MGNYGIKIAKAGKELTSTTPSDYHFWSKYRSKSIVYQGTLGITTLTGSSVPPVTTNYPHNFGYIPQFHVFVTSVDGNYVNCNYQTGGNYGYEGDLWSEILTAYTTSTQLVVSADYNYFTPQSGTWTGLAHTYTFNIVIFMEEVETS
uniref:Uncharacterized protein n=1 Tax=viral metagenome TaxID=1070528 RepID=A0A6M3L3R0_9ZZZZ